MHSLAGKRALICGSSRGIGRACAVEFARLGARVTLLARDEAALREVRDGLPGPDGGPDAWVVHAGLDPRWTDLHAVAERINAGPHDDDVKFHGFAFHSPPHCNALERFADKRCRPAPLPGHPMRVFYGLPGEGAGWCDSERIGSALPDL